MLAPGFENTTCRLKSSRQATTFFGICISPINYFPWLVAYDYWGPKIVPLNYHSSLRQSDKEIDSESIRFTNQVFFCLELRWILLHQNFGPEISLEFFWRSKSSAILRQKIFIGMTRIL